MKKIFAALVCLCVISVNAQTVDQVIQKYTDKMGGLANFAKVKTAKLSGELHIQGQDASLLVQIINGKSVPTDVEVMGNQIVSAYSNGKGWKINPFAGAENATEVTGTELADLKSQVLVGNMLMNYKAFGHKVELKGQEDHNGVKTYKVTLTNKDDGETTTFFINASDYSLVASQSEKEMMGQKAMIETTYSDPKVVNGLVFYMTRVQKADGAEISSITFDKIEAKGPYVGLEAHF
ncbi:MAG: hypothetical protein EOO88_33280 [Pedobacter sp.]|nr:MAG: hypothetical protein EOO88_33280 [Pedobacter sp.]